MTSTKRPTPERSVREWHTDEYHRLANDAEHLADRANHFTYGDGGDPTTGAALAAEAQARATLALAAALMATAPTTTERTAATFVTLTIHVHGSSQANLSEAVAQVQRSTPRTQA
ncbi:hypothetical protein AB0I72_19390 [Nocardiopsis sp. NPDC049922]|uniref:hypothetical protein n=1 Tax=Nocardiopsis sp. NPDC049922 TaxID=3155157 RepID=UPI0034066B44